MDTYLHEIERCFVSYSAEKNLLQNKTPEETLSIPLCHCEGTL